MEERICKTCKHFRMHYIRYGRGNYSALHYGHCVKPRLKKRQTNDKACSYWEAAVKEVPSADGLLCSDAK